MAVPTQITAAMLIASGTSRRDLFAAVPEAVQPLVVMLAGAIPFIEGEGASPIRSASA